MITSIIANAIFKWLFIGVKEVVVLQITCEPASIITNVSPVRLFFSVNMFLHPQSSQLFTITITINITPLCIWFIVHCEVWDYVPLQILLFLKKNHKYYTLHGFFHGEQIYVSSNNRTVCNTHNHKHHICTAFPRCELMLTVQLFLGLCLFKLLDFLQFA